MAITLVLQYVIIAIAVVISAWVVLHKQFPSAAKRLRSRLATWLLRSNSSSLHSMAKKIAPASLAKSKQCGGCDGCD